MSLHYTYATREELPRIVEIYNQIIPSRIATADLEPVSVDDRVEWFNSFDKHHPIWTIKDDDGNIIGWVSLAHFYGRAAYVHTAEISIYLDTKQRHHGVGSQTLEYVFSHLDRLGIKTVLAYIFGHNTPSQNLFKKYGFETWGHLPRMAEMDGVERDLDILGRRFSD